LIAAPVAIAFAAQQNEQIKPFVDLINDVIKATKVNAKGDVVVIKTVIDKELMGKMEKAVKKAKGDD
jgi:hypothetical protein